MGEGRDELSEREKLYDGVDRSGQVISELVEGMGE